MCQNYLSVCFLLIALMYVCDGQVIQFGTCAEVATMKYFSLERFLGQWYEVARFPTWYENQGSCAYKRIEYCGRRIEIEHVFIRDGVQFILHVNSTYYPGDEAIFVIQENNIDPVGIPLTVLSTDYVNYALLYGCRNNEEMGIKYISAWILSRNSTLSEDIYLKATEQLNAVPNANVAYLQQVEQREEKCGFHWTAHVQAVAVNNTEEIKYYNYFLSRATGQTENQRLH